MKKLLTTIVSSVCLANQAVAQEAVIEKDSVPQTKEVKNRNVMLNASAANKPREISIGLPAAMSMTIFEDGTPVSGNVLPCLPFKAWKGGVSTGRFALMSLGESVIRQGSVGYSIDSYVKTGAEKFDGSIDYKIDHYGKQNFDVSLAGPIAKGWQYSINTYQNFDPGSNKPSFTSLSNRMQLYKLGLTKTWATGKATLFYKFSEEKEWSDANGPIYYEGNGKSKQRSGFDLGHDYYFPSDGFVKYRDVETGQMVQESLADGLCNDRDIELNLIGENRFKNGMLFDFRSKYKSGRSFMTNNALTGVDENVSESYGFTYVDGTPYSGDVQNRYFMNLRGTEKSWFNNFQLSQTCDNHSWRVGLDFRMSHYVSKTATAMESHEVSPSPRMLYQDGEAYWLFNTGAEMYKGHDTKTAIYLSDDWQITPRLWASAGVRLEYERQSGDGLFNEDGQTNNDRCADFNLTMPGVKLNKFKKNWFNPSADFNARYTLFHGFGVVAEYLFNRKHNDINGFANATQPLFDPADIHFVRAGLFYNNSWLQLVSQVSYITQSNNNGTAQFTKQINGISETVVDFQTYDIATFGWTTDAVITPFKGFQFHGLFTIQSPKYKNFALAPKFSDGSSDEYTFSDRIVPGISKIIVELNPSYMNGPWRVWASFRYQSKQYMNKTNSLWFNGRWETFAGIDYRLNKHVSFSGQIINFLNQKGVSGSIASADLVSDASAYTHYLMSGNYIRPLT